MSALLARSAGGRHRRNPSRALPPLRRGGRRLRRRGGGMMLRLGLAVAVAIAIVDQLSKAWILDFFGGRPTAAPFQPLTGFFNLALTWNRGMSFGLFNNDAALNAVIFTVVAVVI